MMMMMKLMTICGCQYVDGYIGDYTIQFCWDYLYYKDPVIKQPSQMVAVYIMSSPLTSLSTVAFWYEVSIQLGSGRVRMAFFIPGQPDKRGEVPKTKIDAKFACKVRMLVLDMFELCYIVCFCMEISWDHCWCWGLQVAGSKAECEASSCWQKSPNAFIVYIINWILCLHTLTCHDTISIYFRIFPITAVWSQLLPCPVFSGGRHFERMPQGSLSLNESTWRWPTGAFSVNATVFLEDPFVILGSMEEAEMRFDGGGISCRKALSVFEYFFWVIHQLQNCFWFVVFSVCSLHPWSLAVRPWKWAGSTQNEK